MDDLRIAAVAGPTHRHDVKAGVVAEQAVFLQIGECEFAELSLLGRVHRFGGSQDVRTFG
jgi:hypothetical protein